MNAFYASVNLDAFIVVAPTQPQLNTAKNSNHKWPENQVSEHLLMRVLEQDRLEIVSLRMSNAAPMEGGGPSKALCNPAHIDENTQLDCGRSLHAVE